MEWFLYDNGLRHERVNNTISQVQSHSYSPKNDNNDMWVARLLISYQVK